MIKRNGKTWRNRGEQAFPQEGTSQKQSFNTEQKQENNSHNDKINFLEKQFVEMRQMMESKLNSKVLATKESANNTTKYDVTSTKTIHDQPNTTNTMLQKLTNKCKPIQAKINRTKARRSVRRGKRIRNTLHNFKIMCVNIRGIKSKQDSVKEKVDFLKPTIVCFMEMFLKGDDKIEFDGYKTFLLNRETEGGGLLVAVRKEINNITHIVNEDVSNGEMIWIVIDNTKLHLRLGLIYAPQESRSTTVQLKKIYDKI